MTLWNWLPARLSLSQPIVVFTTQQHGFRLQTLLEKIDQIEYSILVIKTTTGEVEFRLEKCSIVGFFSPRSSAHFVLVFGRIVIVKHILVLVNRFYIHSYHNKSNILGLDNDKRMILDNIN